MSEELNEGIKFMVNTLKESKNFIITQTPEYIQQMVTYHSVMAYIGLTIGIMLMIGGLICIYWNREDRDEGCYLIVCIIFLLALAFIGINTNTLLKIKIAPKVFILDMLKNKIHE